MNDLGVARDGTGADHGPAQDVVDEIVAAGGEAVANTDDIADWDGARRLVHTAIDTFGGLDVLVNNAGFVRDRMLFTTSEDEWDAVIRVHLKGHFATTRHATEWWRAQAKAGEPVDGRIVNTSSGAGLMGSVGQGAYSAAKAGIAALTLVEAAEMGRYGVTANAIAPAARTRMTEEVFADRMQAPDSGFDVNDPANISPLVVWLGSADSRDVTGRVFEVEGGMISVADGWQHGPQRRPGRALGAGRGRRRRAQAARAGADARTGLRHAMTRAHPAPPEVQADWRALGVWTDETLLDRLARADGDRARDRRRRHAPDGRRPARRGRPRSRPRCGDAGVRPGDVVAWQLPNWWEGVVLCWAVVALRRDREPDHADACARTRSASSSTRRGARVVGRPARVPRHRLSGAACATTGFDGDGHRGARRRSRCPTSTRRPPAVDVARRRSGA